MRHVVGFQAAEGIIALAHLIVKRSFAALCLKLKRTIASRTRRQRETHSDIEIARERQRKQTPGNPATDGPTTRAPFTIELLSEIAFKKSSRLVISTNSIKRSDADDQPYRSQPNLHTDLLPAEMRRSFARIASSQEKESVIAML